MAELRRNPDPNVLRPFLAHRSNLVVAKAAEIAADLRVIELMPDLVAAWDRLMCNPAKLDKGCAGTTSIAAALCALDYLEPEPYLKGIRHVQMEPSFGGPVDNAVRLRGQCALGLIRTNHPDAPFEVVDLLTDREPGARAGAARAIGAMPGIAPELLLRLKVHIGDREADVIAECFTGILASGTERSFSFVAPYLDHDDEAIAEAAILSFAATRSIRAFEILKEKWQRKPTSAAIRRTLLIAFATLRVEPAAEFLRSLTEADPGVRATLDRLLGTAC